MPRLSELRKDMRRSALQNAATMIEQHDAGTESVFGDEVWPEEKVKMYREECERLSQKLMRMADEIE